MVIDVGAAPNRLLVYSSPSYGDKECGEEKSFQWVKL